MGSNPALGTISTMDIKIRAGDVRFDFCPVFELDEDTEEFIMLSDKEFRYDKDVVYEDEDFLVFEVTPGDEDNDEIGTVSHIKKDL